MIGDIFVSVTRDIFEKDEKDPLQITDPIKKQIPISIEIKDILLNKKKEGSVYVGVGILFSKN